MKNKLLVILCFLILIALVIRNFSNNQPKDTLPSDDELVENTYIDDAPVWTPPQYAATTETALVPQPNVSEIPLPEIPEGWHELKESDLPARYIDGRWEPLMLVGGIMVPSRDFHKSLRKLSLEQRDQATTKWMNENAERLDKEVKESMPKN